MDILRYDWFVPKSTDWDPKFTHLRLDFITGPVTDFINFALISAYSVLIGRFEWAESANPTMGRIAWLGTAAGVLSIAYRPSIPPANPLDNKSVQQILLGATAPTAFAVLTILFFCRFLLSVQDVV
jgi:hypothetical protein